MWLLFKGWLLFQRWLLFKGRLLFKGWLLFQGRFLLKEIHHRTVRGSPGHLCEDRGVLFPNRPVKYHHVNVPLFIVGDPAYSLLEWLMKPYSDTGRLTPHQLNFNYQVSRARNVVENAFGRLKARWRCLLKLNDSSLERVRPDCCLLHPPQYM